MENQVIYFCTYNYKVGGVNNQGTIYFADKEGEQIICRNPYIGKRKDHYTFINGVRYLAKKSFYASAKQRKYAIKEEKFA